VSVETVRAEPGAHMLGFDEVRKRVYAFCPFPVVRLSSETARSPTREERSLCLFRS
jgi:hypothetical protein